MTTHSPAVETDEPPDLDSDILAALAAVRCVPESDLRTEQAVGGGHLEMDSPEAVAVIAKLEVQYNRQLARVEDLEPEQLTSAEGLGVLLRSRWSGNAGHPTRPVVDA